MNHEDQQETLRVSVEEVEQATLRQVPRRVLRPRPAGYGSIAHADARRVTPERGSILFQGWFYLGAAGLLGSLAAWAIAEPGYVDGPVDGWGKFWLMPLVVSLMCVGLAVAESLVERSQRKSLNRAGLALLLGMVLGFVFNRIADGIYQYGLNLAGPEALKALAPSVWVARGVAWAVIGVAGGMVYGIVGKSVKRAAYGALGGALGAAVGGLIFDPISLITQGGAPSRAIGLSLLGLSTGAAIGLVESVLKSRWLYVTAGPLAGKQFILYKNETIIGSNQSCDIYLFKDPEIEPDHAVLQLRASCLFLRANGPVSISGEPVRGEQMLENGATIQIGRYCFRYQEKEP